MEHIIDYYGIIEPSEIKERPIRKDKILFKNVHTSFDNI